MEDAVSGSNADWLKIGSEQEGSDSEIHCVEGEHLWFLWLIERVTTLKEEQAAHWLFVTTGDIERLQHVDILQSCAKALRRSDAQSCWLIFRAVLSTQAHLSSIMQNFLAAVRHQLTYQPLSACENCTNNVLCYSFQQRKYSSTILFNAPYTTLHLS